MRSNYNLYLIKLIVEALKSQMLDDPQLTVPIVDCFSNLNLPPDLTVSALYIYIYSSVI